MKYERFKTLPVWKASARLFVATDSLAEQPSFRPSGDVQRQLLPAALSVSNNIAEGFERGTISELINFLDIARGSAAEARSMLTMLLGIERFADLRSEIADVRSQTESIIRVPYINGPRY